MENLDLSFNQLTGAMPGQFAYLTKLTNLDLSNNMFSVSLQRAIIGNWKCPWMYHTCTCIPEFLMAHTCTDIHTLEIWLYAGYMIFMAWPMYRVEEHFTVWSTLYESCRDCSWACFGAVNESVCQASSVSTCHITSCREACRVPGEHAQTWQALIFLIT